MRNEEFEPLMRVLCATFKREPSTDLLLAYWMVFEKFSIDDFTRSVKRAIAECKFMPVPAELISLSGHLGVSERAVLAWTRVLRAVSTCGPYKAIDFEDRAINAVIRNMGGWPTFCALFDHGPEDEKWTRKDFIKTYESIAGRNVGDEEGKSLGGMSTGQILRGELVAPIPVAIECDSASDRDKGRSLEHLPSPYEHKPQITGPVPVADQLAQLAIEDRGAV